MDTEEVEAKKPFHVLFERLPKQYPTHLHQAEFWEKLGRAVATYGFLEDVLARAIFCFVSMKRYSPSEIEEAYQSWMPKLEKAISNNLGPLIDIYNAAVLSHSEPRLANFSNLISNLKQSVEIRNVLCHGSWDEPDKKLASLPRFVDRKLRVFETRVDVHFLIQVQQHVAELSTSVVSSVTPMGWAFPGTLRENVN